MPISLFNRVSAELRALIYQRNTLKQIIKSTIVSRYADAWLGTLWTILSPLFFMFSIWLVFSHVTVIKMPWFPLFLLSGILPWTFFSASCAESSHAISGNRGLLTQFTIQPSFYVYAITLNNALHYIISIAALMPFFLWYKPSIIYTFLLSIPLCIFFFIFTNGLCLVIACISVFMKDIAHILQTGLTLLFWLTPIFYTPDVLPVSLRSVLMFNPLCPYIILFRTLLYDAGYGAPLQWFSAVMMSILCGILGIYLFQRQSSCFIKNL